MRYIFLGNADTAIFDRNGNRIIFSGVDRYFNASAGGCVLDGIINQVAKYLSQSNPVAFNLKGLFRVLIDQIDRFDLSVP